MEFLGLSGTLPKEELDQLDKLLFHHGYSRYREIEINDPELNDGLKRFVELISGNFLIQVLNRPNEGSSAKITEEINDFFIFKTMSNFLNWLVVLNGEPCFKGRTLYLIFASEWEERDRHIRFYRNVNVDDVIKYFGLNNGWPQMFFNMDTKNWELEFNIPLVFEINLGSVSN
ncbi:MAG: hypothetical protein JNN29_02855 [Chitinophagaceae bacterium]|nr:hypothetical protein [Chitinophagaceae bacterium]MBN8667464.1 hypothetical protein [Chitinophagales bacterium]